MFFTSEIILPSRCKYTIYNLFNKLGVGIQTGIKSAVLTVYIVVYIIELYSLE